MQTNTMDVAPFISWYAKKHMYKVSTVSDLVSSS